VAKFLLLVQNITRNITKKVVDTVVVKKDNIKVVHHKKDHKKVVVDKVVVIDKKKFRRKKRNINYLKLKFTIMQKNVLAKILKLQKKKQYVKKNAESESNI